MEMTDTYRLPREKAQGISEVERSRPSTGATRASSGRIAIAACVRSSEWDSAASIQVSSRAARAPLDPQRRNASGSPPSTGITWPVVLALWSPASQQIAFAQSAGRIGRRVIVRCA